MDGVSNSDFHYISLRDYTINFVTKIHAKAGMISGMLWELNNYSTIDAYVKAFPKNHYFTETILNLIFEKI
jgi:hypothetical protein